MTFKPGKYYFGELFWVMGSSWDEVSSLSFDKTKKMFVEGVYTLSDEREFYIIPMPYETGTFWDQNNKIFMFDTKHLGLIKSEYIKEITDSFNYDDNIIDFDKEFEIKLNFDEQTGTYFVTAGHITLKPFTS